MLNLVTKTGSAVSTNSNAIFPFETSLFNEIIQNFENFTAGVCVGNSETLKMYSVMSLSSWSIYYRTLLTYSTVQSPSREADWFVVSQEIPCILWNDTLINNEIR